MEYNPDKVRKLSSEILTAHKWLEDLRRMPKDDFLRDPHKIASAKYNLIIAIEAILDLCNHLIAKNGFRAPEDYADTIKVLAERGAFDADFTNILIQMTRFRNRLVHIYWEVDDNELYQILQTRLDDFRQFLNKFGIFIGPSISEG